MAKIPQFLIDTETAPLEGFKGFNGLNLRVGIGYQEIHEWGFIVVGDNILHWQDACESLASASARLVSFMLNHYGNVKGEPASQVGTARRYLPLLSQEAVTQMFRDAKEHQPEPVFSPIQVCIQAAMQGATNEQIAVARGAVGDWTVNV